MVLKARVQVLEDDMKFCSSRANTLTGQVIQLNSQLTTIVDSHTNWITAVVQGGLDCQYVPPVFCLSMSGICELDSQGACTGV